MCASRLERGKRGKKTTDWGGKREKRGGKNRKGESTTLGGKETESGQVKRHLGTGGVGKSTMGVGTQSRRRDSEGGRGREVTPSSRGVRKELKVGHITKSSKIGEEKEKGIITKKESIAGKVVQPELQGHVRLRERGG